MSRGNQVVGDAVVMLDHEMKAFDVLGPQCRKALSEARFQFSALGLLRTLLDLGADLTDPNTDRGGARAIREQDAKVAFQLAMKEGRL